MAAVIMDGKALAATVRAEVAEDALALDPSVWRPCSSATTRHPTSTSAPSTTPRTRRDIESRDDRLARRAPPRRTCYALVQELNGDDTVDGILVQLPLPDGMDETRITHAVAPIKDVDGFHPVNAGHLYLGTPLHVPATPAGCMELLRAYDIELARQGGRRDRAQRDRRQADGDAPARRARDRHDVPFADRGPRRARPSRPTSSSPRSAARGSSRPTW